jgi:branched-subunit amino acid ABC-type transport system permease component
MGSFWGTFWGAMIVGPVYAMGILVFPRLSIIFIYVIMILILITRPWGLLGRPLER